MAPGMAEGGAVTSARWNFPCLATTSANEISFVEQAASALLGVPVDLVLDDAIRPDLRDRILNEAVPL